MYICIYIYIYTYMLIITALIIELLMFLNIKGDNRLAVSCVIIFTSFQ